MFETSVAQSRMVDGRRSSNLLVVIKERPSEANAILESILNTWTYIKWPAKGEDSDEKVAKFYTRLKQSILSKGSLGSLKY